MHHRLSVEIALQDAVLGVDIVVDPRVHPRSALSAFVLWPYHWAFLKGL